MGSQNNQDLIEQLRVLVYRYAREHADDFDLVDIQKRIAPPGVPTENANVKHRDSMIRRLLKSAKRPDNLDSALEKFVDVFKFRKEFKVNQMNVGNCCPAEFYRIRPLVVGGTDLEGNRVFIIRIRYYQTLRQFDTIIKHFLVYQMEQQDSQLEQGEHKGLTVIVDCQEFNYRYLDLDMVNFLVQMTFKFPKLTKKILFYELAWGFGFLFKMVEKLITAQQGIKEKMLYQTNKSNLTQFISQSQLPEFILNGPRKVNRAIHKDALPFAEMVKGTLFKEVIENENATKIAEYLQTLL